MFSLRHSSLTNNLALWLYYALNRKTPINIALIILIYWKYNIKGIFIITANH